MKVVIITTFLILTCNNVFSNAHENSLEKIIKVLVPGYADVNPEEYEELAEHAVIERNEHPNIEVIMNITQLIRYNGFKAEEYLVKTEDGYILGLFRVRGDGPVIFLMHGLLASADDWVTAGTETGLAYLLAALGFDVWMGNARGNKHSRHHKTLSPESPEFWDFSFYEIGIYDLPAMIDFVLDATNQSQLIYIGHSQGTTNFFVMASEKPEYNSKVTLMIALAPAAPITNVRTPILLFLRALTLDHLNIFFRALRLIGYNEFLPETPLSKLFTIAVCGNRFLQWICNAIVYNASGLDLTQLNYTTLPTIHAHIPAGSATKVLEHYGQTVGNGKFRKFDYGTGKNMEEYGSKIPPEFPITDITTPIALFYGANDKITVLEDVLTLRQKLRSVIKSYEVTDIHFNHLDFVYAKDFNKLVFPHILDLIYTSGIQEGNQ